MRSACLCRRARSCLLKSAGNTREALQATCPHVVEYAVDKHLWG